LKIVEISPPKTAGKLKSVGIDYNRLKLVILSKVEGFEISPLIRMVR